MVDFCGDIVQFFPVNSLSFARKMVHPVASRDNL